MHICGTWKNGTDELGWWWCVPLFLLNFPPEEIWSVPVSVYVEGNPHLRRGKGNPFTLSSRAPRGPYCISCLLSERRSTVLATASLSKPSLLDQSEGHVYEM